MGKENEKAYAKGYEDGKKGWFGSDFSQSFKNVVPIQNSKKEDSYDAGYSKGREDRYKTDFNLFK